MIHKCLFCDKEYIQNLCIHENDLSYVRRVNDNIYYINLSSYKWVTTLNIKSSNIMIFSGGLTITIPMFKLSTMPAFINKINTILSFS